MGIEQAIHEVKEGMVLDTHVYHPQVARLLLPRGTPLSDKQIQMLQMVGVRKVKIFETQVINGNGELKTVKQLKAIFNGVNEESAWGAKLFELCLQRKKASS